DGIRDFHVTGVQTCALPISLGVVLDAHGLEVALHPAVQALGVVWIADGLACLACAFLRHQPVASAGTCDGLSWWGPVRDRSGVEIGRASCRAREGVAVAAGG